MSGMLLARASFEHAAKNAMYSHYGYIREPHQSASNLQQFTDSAVREWKLTTAFNQEQRIGVTIASVVAKDGKLDFRTIKVVDALLPQRCPSPEEFEAAMDEIVKDLPDEIAAFVRQNADERGHSAGMEEILSVARGLAGELIPQCRKLVTRLTETTAAHGGSKPRKRLDTPAAAS